MNVIIAALSNQALHLIVYWVILEGIELLVTLNRRPGYGSSTEFRLREFRLVFGGGIPVVWLANTIDENWFPLQLLGFGAIFVRFVFLKR